jgi:hypothetical protein
MNLGGKHLVLGEGELELKYIKPLNIKTEILETFPAVYETFYSKNSYMLRYA